MVIHPNSPCIGSPCFICGAKNRNPIQPAEVAAAEQAVLAEVDSLKAQLAAANEQLAVIQAQHGDEKSRADHAWAQLDEIRAIVGGGIGEEQPKFSVQRKLAENAEQLAGANAQRDELLRAAKAVQGLVSDDLAGPCIVDFRRHDVRDLWDAFVEAIARAQSGQPAQRDDDGTASGGGAQ